MKAQKIVSLEQQMCTSNSGLLKKSIAACHLPHNNELDVEVHDGLNDISVILEGMSENQITIAVQC